MKVQVLLPKIFNLPFTYNLGHNKNYKKGDVVEIPFGSKKEIGVIWNNINSDPKNIKIKDINKKIENFSINQKLMKFIEWFSMYNMVPRGMALKMCIGNTRNLFKKKDQVEKSKKIKVKKYSLNSQQENSLKYLEDTKGRFKVSVLQGTTGSGKTLVYFERIKKVIEEKKQALVLLPEIFLTNQFQTRFENFFGFSPAIWHSKITPKNKRIILKGIIENKIKLIIGARSSLMLPFKKLGIIVVDEEHDVSYKQDEGVIYNARDMAISRAFFEDIPIDLVSSIPSIETYNNIKNKKYRHVKISERYNNYPLPNTKIINLNFNRLKDKYIADETIHEVKKFLKKKEQVLFFINRRGFSPLLVCKNCGYKHLCSNCSLYLTFHKLKNKAICHHCGLERNIKKKCNKNDDYCKFIMFGPGVEKIFEEVKKIFPDHKINIFSSDFMRKKNEVQSLFSRINENKIDILIGTQMISKGFNFPKLNCIVVVDADFSGRGYDLRATEKNIQLYHQLSGRAGRFSSQSLIIYQTLSPDNEILKNLIVNDPEQFLENELILRKNNKLPPFSRLISLIISSNSKHLSFRGAQEIKSKLNTIKELEIMGPVDSPILRMKKSYRCRLLIRFNNSQLFQKKIAKLLNNLKISSRIKLTVDVDPVNFT